MLISDIHRQRYQQYYAARGAVVIGPHAWQPLVDALVREIRATSVLDYGCGPAGNLARYAGYLVQNYDPGVPEFSQLPDPADVVVCVHTLEHVESDAVAAVLQDIWWLAHIAIFCVIACQPSTKVLPDGTPWHTMVDTPHGWHLRLLTAWPAVRTRVLSLADQWTEYRSLWYVGETP